MSSSVGSIVIEWVNISNVPNHPWTSHPYALAPPRSQPSEHTCVPNHQPETWFPTEWVKINVINIFQTNNHQPSKTIKHNKQTHFSTPTRTPRSPTQKNLCCRTSAETPPSCAATSYEAARPQHATRLTCAKTQEKSWNNHETIINHHPQ